MLLKLAVLVLFCYFTCQGIFLDSLPKHNQCQNDTDCQGGCCHMGAVGARCYNFSQMSQPCHLPNHHINVLLYPCGCAQGLTCKEIHFDSSMHVLDVNGSDPIGQVETCLLTHGYGLCENHI